MATSFENFVNVELPKRLATNVSPTAPTVGQVPVFTGVGLLTENKAPSELGLVTPTDLTTAISTALSSVYTFQTLYNPTVTNQYPTSANTVGSVPIKKGFLWIISGIVGQQAIGTKTVNNGDSVMALIDNAGAAVDTDWHITEANLGYTPENQNNKDTDGTLAANSDTKYPSQKAVKTYADTKQAALANVITAGTYGNTTQYPVLTFNTKGICTGVTLQTVDKTLTETTFAVEKTGASAIKVTWILTALTTARAWTIPDKAINLGDLPSVATTNNNVLSGTRTFCVMGGGSSASLGNKIQGTDTGAIGSTGCDMRGTRNIAYNSTNVGTAATATDNSFYNCSSPLPAELVTTIGVRYINCKYPQLAANPTTYGGTWPNYSTVEGVNQNGATKCTTGLTSINFNSYALTPLTAAGSGSTEVLAYQSNYYGQGISVHDIIITCFNYNDTAGAVFRRTIVVNAAGTIVSATTPAADVTYGGTTYTPAISVVGRVLRITVASSISSASGAFANVVSLYQ